VHHEESRHRTPSDPRRPETRRRLPREAASAPAPPPPRCGIRAAFDADACRVHGTATWTFANTTDAPLDHLLVSLYANRLLRPNKALNDVTYPWSYPRAFNPGYLELDRISFPGNVHRPESPAFVARPRRPDKTLMRIGIRPPLPRGESLTVRMPFTTLVPKKYGTFGRYLGDVLLNGGWYPALPVLDPGAGWRPEAAPPHAEFDVLIEKPEELQAVINGALTTEGGAAVYRGEGRYLTLSLAGTFHRYEKTSGDAEVVYFRLSESSASGRKVCEEAGRVLDFYRQTYGAPGRKRIVFLEGHFRTQLSAHGEGMGLLSDHLLHVLPYPIDLRKYHMREVAFETLYLLEVEGARARESAMDWNCVAEGLAWAALREYLAWRDKNFDEITDVLSTFSFIPVIDQTLVAPRFPFADVFFDTFFKREPLREGILRYNNPIPFGRMVIEKAKDTVGAKAWSRALAAVREEGATLKAALEKASGEDLDWFARQWREGYPRRNLEVGEIEEEELEEGRWRISTEILRHGGEDFIEPVEVGVKTGEGDKFLGTVRIDSARTVDRYVYPAAWDQIVLDPRGRVWETNRTDNRRPRKPKILVTAFNPRLEWRLETPVSESTLRLDLYGGFAGILQGDYANQVHLNYFYNQRGVGATLGYFRAFNMKLDRTDFRQGVGAFVNLERLAKEFALAEDVEAEEKDRLLLTSTRIFYVVDTRLDRKNPHHGAYGRVSLELAERILGTDFSYQRLFWDLRWLYSPVREHILAFNVRGGLSWGRLPAQRRYSAGGFYGVRGIPENEALGSQGLVFRWEYRHLWLHDLNLNFFWFGWIRRVQGALFLETGIVADEQAGLFRIQDFRSGWGYGIRIEFDSFGVRPFLVGVDIGWRLDEVGDEPIFYLTVAQSF